MDWSVKRRLTYLLVVLAVIILAGALVWFWQKPEPSCDDGKRNQGEYDVDCGGPCARVCAFEVRPVREVWSRIFQTDDNRYDQVTLLKNPNLGYIARQLHYRVRVFDASDVLLTTREGTAFLNPAEELFIYHGRLEVGERTPRRASFEIMDGPVWQRLSAELPSLRVTFRSFAADPPILTAEIVNDSLVTLTDVTVVAVLSDEEQNALAVSSTLVESLSRGERRELAFTWPKRLPIPPSFFDFYTHFDPARLR